MTSCIQSDNILIVQDLADILRINQERATGYNKCAYSSLDLNLKTLLHRELDNARDTIFGIRRHLNDRFEINGSHDSIGEIYCLWYDLKPSFEVVSLDSQLESFEKADLLTLQCYHMVIARPYIDKHTRSLLEFYDQCTTSVYSSLHSFHEAYNQRWYQLLVTMSNDHER